MSGLNYFLEWQDNFKEEISKNIHTSLPAKIINYDSVNNKADVQVMIHKLDLDDNRVDIPPFYNVPVWVYRNNDFLISLPIKNGDYGFITFFERDIDNYKDDGVARTPENKRFHSYNDGIFIPGFYPSNNTPTNLSNDNLVIRDVEGDIEICLTPNKEIEIKQFNITKLKLKNDGSFDVNGNINVVGDFIANGISLVNHIHGGVENGPGFTGGPI